MLGGVVVLLVLVVVVVVFSVTVVVILPVLVVVIGLAVIVVLHVLMVVMDVGAECILPVAQNGGGWRERQEASSLSNKGNISSLSVRLSKTLQWVMIGKTLYCCL